MSKPNKRLIEHTLPLHAISEQSAREKSIRHGHISTLHIWWARRPLAAMRAAIFAALVPAPENDEERKDLEDLIATIVDWDQVKDGNSPAIERARELIREAYPDGPPKLLDPFMGGGATGLEALRLGCETHAVELNPVAHLIELCTLVYPQKYGRSRKRIGEPDDLKGKAKANRLVESVKHWGNWMLDQGRSEVGHVYENPEGEETIIGYLWMRTVTCPNPDCHTEIPLTRDWWLARRGRRRIALKPIRDPGQVEVSFAVVEYDKAQHPNFDPNKGTVTKLEATCPLCGTVAPREYVRREGKSGRLGQRMVAVITSSSKLQEYRPATEADLLQFSEASSLLGVLDPHGTATPTGAIPGRDQTTNSLAQYGIDKWKDLFNPRQRLVLAGLIRQVHTAYGEMIKGGEDSEYARAVTTYLALAIDHLLSYGSSLTQWHASAERPISALSRMTLSAAWKYVEVNPTRNGSVWDMAIWHIVGAIEHASAASDEAATVQQGTATQLPYPDAYFDAIITDPPYYDAVPYSDLSDYYYVWLRKSVGFLYPDILANGLIARSEEQVPYEDQPQEVIAEQSARDRYTVLLTKAFKESARVLTSDGILGFLYAFHTFSSLELLFGALSDAGLQITAILPYETGVRSERTDVRSVQIHLRPIFVVCQKMHQRTPGTDYLYVRAQVRLAVRNFLSEQWAAGCRPDDLFLRATGPALKIFGENQPAVMSSGEKVTVSELLEVVQDEVADFLVLREQ